MLGFVFVFWQPWILLKITIKCRDEYNIHCTLADKCINNPFLPLAPFVPRLSGKTSINNQFENVLLIEWWLTAYNNYHHSKLAVKLLHKKTHKRKETPQQHPPPPHQKQQQPSTQLPHTYTKNNQLVGTQLILVWISAWLRWGGDNLQNYGAVTFIFPKTEKLYVCIISFQNEANVEQVDINLSESNALMESEVKCCYCKTVYIYILV